MPGRFGIRCSFAERCGNPIAALLMPLAGCAAGPPAGGGAIRDPVEAITSVFSEAIPGNPHAAPFLDRDVVAVDAEAISWRPLEAPDQPLFRLRYADIAAVAYHIEAELPSRPEAIFIYLRPGGSAAGEAGAVRAPLEAIGLSRPYLVLRRRPSGSFRRLREALAALGFTPGSL